MNAGNGRQVAAPTLTRPYDTPLRGGKKLASAEAEASLETREILSGTPGRQQPGQRESISSIVRSIKTLTSKEIGESIFQRSYYDHVIRNQADYDEIWQYIENNPKKWALDRDMV